MKIVIIGAGVAGLSAGCYLRMNGFDTEIFEMHSKSGGRIGSVVNIPSMVVYIG